eukprot:9778022-Ditylum_brightwellii.AAC.1
MTEKKKKSKHAPTESPSIYQDYYTSLHSNQVNIDSSGVGITIRANAYNHVIYNCKIPYLDIWIKMFLTEDMDF